MLAPSQAATRIFALAPSSNIDYQDLIRIQLRIGYDQPQVSGGTGCTRVQEGVAGSK